ncbi:glycoside hydrolase family 88 protein [Paenibacillus donghaensis]|uniref:Glycosyl hydrolase n=1 Tax=Paenibacillus donghaensis TaxID=414771 RepID=A0A2Z2KDR6_9BACL|nr:glycoside hydrolase family 88 protein [Paenibacillus donghaensis]ASA24876.1 glycosyl hydrolase [Paenibacillus donghaensis]
MNDRTWIDEAWRQSLEKTWQNMHRIGARFPHASKGGVYELAGPEWWTAGFWPGMLWLLYGESGRQELKAAAEECEAAMDAVLDGYVRLDHDLGFMWTLTSVANYKLTGSEASRIRAMKAANYLAARFNLKGGYIRAWNPWREGERNEGIAIIDCCMNTPLLFWASRTSGDPRYAHIAEAHMDTVLRYFIREDGSVYHMINFAPETGERLEGLGGQGYAPDSAWSRGSAWAIYGLTLAYHHTGKAAYLTAAQRTANFFLSRLAEDQVPAWDFRAPQQLQSLRDSSAASCAASGLILLGETTGNVEGEFYRQRGERMLKSLYETYGAWDNPQEEGLLLHGTSNYPQGTNIDVPLIYGDYYFVEGLARLKGCGPFYWD